MKKLFKSVLSLILILVILVGGTIGVLGYLIIDDTSYTNEKYESKELNPTVGIYNIIEKSLHDTSTTEDISLTLYPEDLDFILYAIIDGIEINSPVPISLNSSKVEFVSGDYIFKVSASYKSFNTVVTLELDFSENNDIFTIKVDNLRIGKLSLNNDFVHSFIDNISTSQLEETLKNNNIYCSINLKELSVSISKDDLINMINKFTSSNSNLNIVNTLLDIYTNDHSLYDFETDELLKLNLHLNKLKYNEEYGEVKNIGLATIDSLTESLLENKVITNIQTNEVFSFLLHGYAPLEDKARQVIDTIDFSSIGILVNSLYPGLYLKDSTTITEHINDINVEYSPGDTSIDLQIDENVIDLVLENNDLIGSSFAFGHEECENSIYSNKVSYISIEHINTELTNDEILISLVINVNGYRIGIHLDFQTNTHEGLILEGSLKEIKIGDLTLSQTQQQEIIDYLGTIINLDWISIDSTSHNIILNFENLIISNSSIKDFIENNNPTTISTSIIDNKINIHFSI